MAWFIVFGKPDSDLEFSKSNGQEMATSLCLANRNVPRVSI
jgi:hypothetical protein